MVPLRFPMTQTQQILILYDSPQETAQLGFIVSSGSHPKEWRDGEQQTQERRWHCWLQLRGSLSKDESNGNDNTRKQWSDWLNEEK